MAWAKLSSALEPYSLDRRIFGFDSFEGFPSVSANEADEAKNARAVAGGFSTDYDVYSELMECIAEYDNNRFLNQFAKVELIRGNAINTIPQFIEENPHVLVSLLFLDFDLYEPTKIAFEHFLSRMSSGSILAFDEVNNPYWPGETTAMLEALDINDRRIQRFPFDPNISYIVL